METNKKIWSAPTLSEMLMEETNSGFGTNRENGESHT